MIERLHPAHLKKDPRDVFRLLLLGQGFRLKPPESKSSEFASVCNKAWEGITAKVPFDVLRPPMPQEAVAVYTELGTDLNLELKTELIDKVPVLSMPESRALDLQNYLMGQVTHEGTSPLSGSALWGAKQQGIKGSLVAILKKEAAGDKSTELYQLDGSGLSQIPLVAVVVKGDLWPQVLARAVAQMMCGLGDEYELNGAVYAKAPFVEYAPRNIIYLTDDQRERLNRGARGEDVLPQLGPPSPQWPVASALRFFPRVGTTLNEAPAGLSPGLGEVQLIEGGAGYRTHVIHGSADCLLRRLPAMILARIPKDQRGASKSVQAPVDFCLVCRAALMTVLKGTDLVAPNAAGLPTLSSQSLVYDRTTWTANAAAGPISADGAPVGGKPGVRWSCTVTADEREGLVVSDLTLDRQGLEDAQPAARDVLRRISFPKVTITFKDQQATDLLVKDAVGKDLAVRTRQPGRPGEALLGIRYTLIWHVQGLEVTAACSLVLCDRQGDADPAGKLLGCKLYPQLALRCYPLPKSRPPRVQALRGQIALSCNVCIPVGAPPEAGVPAQFLGRQLVGLFCESNGFSDGDVDHRYDFPPKASYPAIWHSGRRLAAVSREQDIRIWGDTALYHRTRGDPGLPLWSWLFDYATPAVTTSKHFVATHAAGEDADFIRDDFYEWPEVDGAPNWMYVRKVPRQGAYDCLRIAPFMGSADEKVASAWTDASGRELWSAPLSADPCLELRFRYGGAVIETAGARARRLVLGWGDGRPGQGANTTRYAPLTPPNQHVEVQLDPQGDNTTDVLYDVTVKGPRTGELQVLLEQGLTFFFGYGGLSAAEVAYLGKATSTLSTDQQDALRTLDLIRKSDPAGFATGMRLALWQIAPALRFYRPEEVPELAGKGLIDQLPGKLVDGRHVAPKELEEMLLAYDLRSGDRDGNRTYGGKQRPPGTPALITELQQALYELGFFHKKPDSKTFDILTEHALREFQIYAKMDVAGHEPEGASELIYADRLVPRKIRERYTGRLSGVANAATRRLVKMWQRRRWRCPVVIEAWKRDDLDLNSLPKAAGRPVHERLWQWNDVQDITLRMLARDISSYYPLSPARLSERRIVEGDYASWDGWAGPRSDTSGEIKAANWEEAEFTPENVIGVPINDLSAGQRAAFKIIRAVSEVECDGFLDAVNQWDNVVLSLGPYHWTIFLEGRSSGGLSGLFSFMQRHWTDAFATTIGSFGLRTELAWDKRTAAGRRRVYDSVLTATSPLLLESERGNGTQLITSDPDDDMRTRRNYLRSWHWHHRFVMAARTLSEYRRAIWDMALIRLRELRAAPCDGANPGLPVGTTIGDIFTSERANALLLRWHVRHPALVIGNFKASMDIRDVVKEVKNKDGTPTDLADWGDAQEDALIDALFEKIVEKDHSVEETAKQVRDWPSGDRTRFKLDPSKLDPSHPTLRRTRNSFNALLMDQAAEGLPPP